MGSFSVQRQLEPLVVLSGDSRHDSTDSDGEECQKKAKIISIARPQSLRSEETINDSETDSEAMKQSIEKDGKICMSLDDPERNSEGENNDKSLGGIENSLQGLSISSESKNWTESLSKDEQKSSDGD